MRKYEEKTEPKTYHTLVETTCDLCGTVAKHGEWNSGYYEIDETEIEVTVSQKDGSNYPGGGWGEEYKIDMCPKCFKDRLVPWLISQGAKIEPVKWDW